MSKDIWTTQDTVSLPQHEKGAAEMGINETTLYHNAINTINELREDNKRLSRMLANVIDATYGTSVHHVGDGDGLPDDEAAEIREWWQAHLNNVQREEGLK